MKKLRGISIYLAVSAAFFFAGCSAADGTGWRESEANLPEGNEQAVSVDNVSQVPEYTGEPFVEINGNEPAFEEEELTTVSYEEYSELDELGRCGEAQACIGEDLMPDTERDSISSVTPTGWENQQYDIVDGGYIYNRCHLIGFQLTGENANEKNLITGTRYMNTEGMLPFENEVAEYIRETDNHVMYRVTPVFEGDDLVASGVQMEAESVEDNGSGICFNVYVYNIQPDITIDYTTGYNWKTEEENPEEASKEQSFVLNTNTHKFHRPDCSGAENIKVKNRKEYSGDREQLIREGYEPCGRCKP